jgi:hypothetical protein
MSSSISFFVKLLETLANFLIANKTLILSAVLGTVGVFIGKTYETLIKVRIEDWIQERRSKRALYVNAGFEKYFRMRESIKLDTLVYELGLRPDMPSVDALYMEYARHLLETNHTQEVVLVISRDLSATDQGLEALTTLKTNLTKLFGTLYPRVIVVDADTLLPKYATSLFSRDFLKVLTYMESDDFLRVASEWSGIRIRSMLDFSRHHPLAKRGMSIYVHIVRGWLVRKFLEERGSLSKETAVIGFLIWETEVDKLGVLYQLSTGRRKVIPLLGRSIYSSRGKPVPVFSPGSTLNLFGERGDQFGALEGATKGELSAYADILRTIIRSRSVGADLSGRTMRDAGRSSVAGGELATDARTLQRRGALVFELVGLLDRLEHLYA